MKNDIYSAYLSGLAGLKNMAPAQKAAAGLPEADIALAGGHIVLPEAGIIQANLYVKNGLVSAISREDYPAARTIDVNGKYLLPGIIDPHTHFGIGTDFRADLKSESESAVVGGVTTVGCFIAADRATVPQFGGLAEDIADVSSVDVVPHYVIARPEQLEEIPEMVTVLGLRTFKVYLNGIPGLIPSVDDGFVLEVMERLKQTGERCILFLHCENSAIVERATKLSSKKYGEGAGLERFEESHPAMAEEEAVMRVAFFAEKMQQPVYIVHVSSAEGAQMVRRIKNRYVYAETTSAYLSALSADYTTSVGVMVPPLRKAEDVECLWQAVQDGVIDTIGTDNVTLTLSEKGVSQNVWKTFPGYPLLGTHLPSLLHEGCVRRGIGLDCLVRAITKRPAELMGVYPRKGTLLPGSDADVAVVDMGLVKTVDPALLFSRSDFSIHTGRIFRGWPVLTLKGGVPVAQDGKPTGLRTKAKALTAQKKFY